MGGWRRLSKQLGAVAVGETMAGHRLGALVGGGRVTPPPLPRRVGVGGCAAVCCRAAGGRGRVVVSGRMAQGAVRGLDFDQRFMVPARNGIAVL